MADVIFIMHFVLLLTFKLAPGAGQRTPLLEELPNNLDNKDPEDLPEVKNTGNAVRKKITCYSCEGDDCSSPHICTDAISCWKSRVRQIDGRETVSRSCTEKIDQLPLICTKSTTEAKHGVLYSVECCHSDLCNDGPFPLLEPSKETKDETYVIKLTFAILGPIVMLACAVFFFILPCKARKKRPLVSKCNKLLIDSDMDPSMLHFPSASQSSTGSYHAHELRVVAAGDSTLREYLDGRSLTSGSGSGLPLLVQRTLAKQVALVECLGSGGSSGFGGEVWRGIWHGESVAVKIYFSRDEAAWTRETEVYSQLLPSRHDNILGYVGSDMTSRASCTQLWLVTHYQPLGSLYDHLNRSPHPLTHHQTLNICIGLVNGLLYLHTDIMGTRGKPAIAHRNLKSKNILIKANGSCVISDFALSVTADRIVTDRIDLRQGAKRYMSPEILEQTINISYLEGFQSADIYSLGLVLWEVCRRCICNGVALDYAAPYSEWLPNNTQEPSIEEMRKLVSLDQRRPPIPNRWHSDTTLSGMGKLMRECWPNKPAARLTILRVKKTLIKLAANDSRIHLSLD